MIFPQEENWRKLEQHLRTLPQAKFDMEMIFSGGELSPVPSSMKTFLRGCGTSACALGHATAVIPALEHENWEQYCERNFCLWCGPEFNLIFASKWKYVDNSPAAAADRIKQMLEGTKS